MKKFIKNPFVLFVCCLLFSFETYSQDCSDTCFYYIPNTLIPDCESFGCELLDVSSNCAIFKFQFSLLNRWGKVIFTSKDSNMQFDSRQLPEGAYIWKLTGKYCNGEMIKDSGTINVFR